MKKIICLLVALITSAALIPTYAEAAEYIKIEAENYDPDSEKGDFKEYASAGASNGTVMLINSGINESTLDYSVDIPKSCNYDVWILSCPTLNYLSPLDWKFDDEEYKRNKTTIESVIYRSIFGVGMGWTKLGTEKLEEGAHKMSLKVKDKRSSTGNDMFYIADLIVLSPSAWKWAPDASVDSEPTDAGFKGMWIEAEKFSKAEGFAVSQAAGASGGSYVSIINTKEEEDRKLEYEIAAPNNDDYDIYILGAPVAPYISPIKYSFGGGEEKTAKNSEIKRVYTTPTAIPVSWYKLNEEPVAMEKDTEYTLAFSVESERTAAGGGYVNAIDAIVVTPSKTGLALYGGEETDNMLARDITEIDKQQLSEAMDIYETDKDFKLPTASFSGYTESKWESKDGAVEISDKTAIIHRKVGEDIAAKLGLTVWWKQNPNIVSAAEKEIVIKKAEKFEVNNGTLTYADGSAIGEKLINGATVAASAEITNNREISDCAVMMVVYFGKDGIMEKISVENIELDAGTSAIANAVLKLPDDTENGYAEAYVWDNFKDMNLLGIIFRTGDGK